MICLAGPKLLLDLLQSHCDWLSNHSATTLFQHILKQLVCKCKLFEIAPLAGISVQAALILQTQLWPFALQVQMVYLTRDQVLKDMVFRATTPSPSLVREKSSPFWTHKMIYLRYH